MTTHILGLVGPVVLAGSAALAAGQSESKLIQRCTTPRAARYHVRFVETITSKTQSDWTRYYGAKVSLYIDGKLKLTVRGSTLPNFRPGRTKPRDWVYSVVRSNRSFPRRLGLRFYTWSRGKRSDRKADCLRLAGTVPTVNVGSERRRDAALDRLITNADRRNWRFATNILIHSGASATWRGSAGCLTIHPRDVKKFFDAIPNGVRGTLDVVRGLDQDGRCQYY